MTNQRGETMGEYMSTTRAAELWGCSRDEVARLCRVGRIKGAEQDRKGTPWRIPSDAPNPLKKTKEE